MRGEETS